MPNGHRPDEHLPDLELLETQGAGGNAGEPSIGDYRLLDKLGEGAMGSVFRAFDRRLGRVVALRALPSSFARDHSAGSRFKQEVKAVGRLKHPNLVALLDSGEDRGVPFLVTEFVEGRALDQVVRQRGPLRVGEAIAFLIQAARGLEAAHERGIVHQHIKPSTLMLDNAGTLRVRDLGLATLGDASNIDPRTVDDRAPEQADDSRRADHRADIYSLGCTFYFLMTGRAPFAGETIHERLATSEEQPAPSLCATRPDAPAALGDAFRKMMAKRPDDRPRSMTEVIAMLEAGELSSADANSAFDATSRPHPSQSDQESSLLAPRDEDKAGSPGSGSSLDDLLMNVHSEMPPPAPTIKRVVKPRASQMKPPAQSSPRPSRKAGRPAIIFLLSALALVSVAIVSFVLFPGRTRTDATTPLDATHNSKGGVGDVSDGWDKVEAGPSLPMPEPVVQTIFDGKSGKGWMLTNRKPLPPSRIQPDGLNPHGTGSYLVVYEKKLGDFVLDFDYKLSEGCQSGVFLRVGDLSDPVNTGIKVTLDDTTGTSAADSGAFHELVAPNANVQKPAGQWNHMTITAAGPDLAVSLNGKDVSRINLDEWTVAGKRPDGSDHEVQKRPIAELSRTGYLGFQDHGRDCWFRNITLKTQGKS